MCCSRQFSLPENSTETVSCRDWCRSPGYQHTSSTCKMYTALNRDNLDTTTHFNRTYEIKTLIYRFVLKTYTNLSKFSLVSFYQYHILFILPITSDFISSKSTCGILVHKKSLWEKLIVFSSLAKKLVSKHIM